MLPQDLQAFEAITGHNRVPDGFEETYVNWLRMQHRMKWEGPLNLLMIPLCDKFGLTPPEDSILPGGAINWRAVQKGQRIAVHMDGGGIARGEFIAVGAANLVEVKLDGKDWHLEFKPHQVVLDNTLPTDIKVEESVRRQMEERILADNDMAPLGGDDENFLPRFDPLAHAPQERSRPAMSDPKWYDAKPGDRLLVQQDGEEVDAEFVRLHGADVIVARLRDGDDLVDISQAVLAPLPELKTERKKTGGRPKGSKNKPKTVKATA